MPLKIDYLAIANKAFRHAFRQKWLWIYGLVLSIYGASYARFGNFFPGSSKSKLPKIQDVPKESEKVLGIATDAISQWFSRVSPVVWLTLLLALFVLVIISVLLYWFIRSWAKAGLIAGLADAYDGQKVTLATSSKKGLSSVKNILLYDLVVVGIYFIGLIVFIFSFIFIYVIGKFLPTFGILMGGALFLISIILFLLTLVILSITSIYADRLIVFKNYTAISAFKAGLKLAKKYYKSAVLMGLVNFFVGAGFSCLMFLFVVLLITPVIAVSAFVSPGILNLISNQPSSLLKYLSFIGSSGLLLILGINYLLNFLNGIYLIFKFATWNEIFKEVINLEEQL